MPKWTNEQLDAINKSGTNIIVSAGAGSGKTAVLSERVLRILKEGTHIDELLILTFTNAAAKEMKERIRKKIKENPLLIEELDLIDSAYITTFDSFALSTLKKYHYLLNISPNVSIIDESIINIEKNKIIDEIFEEYYNKEDKKFINLITTFCTKDDESIKKSILEISKKLDLKTDKENYIKEYINNYFNEEKINNDIKEYEELIKNKIEEINNIIEELSLELDDSYIEKLNDSLINLLNSNSYNDIKINLEIKLPTLPKGSSDNVKQLKENINKIIKESKSLTQYSLEEIKENILSTKDYVEVILEIIEKLDKKINEYKFKYDVYEFNDIAKLSIKIIKENKEIREELKNKFKEILVDEYQDTSDIQEEFINLIENNNVYMVGDIKQSIYRFRNANPYIFKNKYDMYSNGLNGIKIDLNKNFRSREEVLNNINIIFNKIMDDKLGGANYKKSHNMIFGNNSYNEKGTTKNNHNMEIISYEDTKEYKKEEIEAFIIANDIEDKIKNKYQVFDKDKGILRNIEYSDFVILMDRTTNFDTYKKIFTYKNIPLIQIKDEKMNDEIDLYVIKNLIKLVLKIKENNLDLEFKYLFISIARSFLFKIDDNEIYKIFKTESFKENIIYKNIEEIVENYDNLTPKLLLDTLLKKFDYYNKLLTITNIQSSLIRINKLKEYASNLETLGYTIYDYSNYLEELIKNDYEMKYSLNEGNTNGVRIMTIHKSKGLEYHICYYSGLYKSFNISDIKERFTYDNKYGIITPYFKEGIGETIYKTLMKENYIKEEISEKIRLFYVALTRSKEKMILVEPKKEVTEKELNNSIKNKYRSFKDILDSIKFNILDFYNEKNIDDIKIDKNYRINKNNNILDTIPTNNKIVKEKNLNIDKQLLKENTYSKKQDKIITKEIKDNMEYGKHMHEIFELADFKNNTNKEIEKFLNHFDKEKLMKANIIKEYEFIFELEDIEYHGIIDLLIEYENNIDIIDYKLKDISDLEYLNQLRGYKEYIENLTNKNVNIYLYSIINDTLKELK
ncbi:MAG: UvrD-helicase domain-containing protein [Bacilli bacterium]|nr:UvrD-helicase domain-containing protein [Bacilli bacterium]